MLEWKQKRYEEKGEHNDKNLRDGNLFARPWVLCLHRGNGYEKRRKRDNIGKISTNFDLEKSQFRFLIAPSPGGDPRGEARWAPSRGERTRESSWNMLKHVETKGIRRKLEHRIRDGRRSQIFTPCLKINWSLRWLPMRRRHPKDGSIRRDPIPISTRRHITVRTVKHCRTLQWLCYPLVALQLGCKSQVKCITTSPLDILIRTAIEKSTKKRSTSKRHNKSNNRSNNNTDRYAVGCDSTCRGGSLHRGQRQRLSAVPLRRLRRARPLGPRRFGDRGVADVGDREKTVDSYRKTKDFKQMIYDDLNLNLKVSKNGVLNRLRCQGLAIWVTNRCIRRKIPAKLWRRTAEKQPKYYSMTLWPYDMLQRCLWFILDRFGMGKAITTGEQSNNAWRFYRKASQGRFIFITRAMCQRNFGNQKVPFFSQPMST